MKRVGPPPKGPTVDASGVPSTLQDCPDSSLCSQVMPLSQLSLPLMSSEGLALELEVTLYCVPKALCVPSTSYQSPLLKPGS